MTATAAAATLVHATTGVLRILWLLGGGAHVLILGCLAVVLIVLTAVIPLITARAEVLLEVAHLLSVVLEALILVPHGATGTTTSAATSTAT